MKIHEYQARQLLAEAGIPVPCGTMVTSVEAANEAAKLLFDADATLLVVKAQVHAGGRGKAGFVKLCRTPEEVDEAATFMFGNKMVSVQTGPEGLDVTKVLIADGVDIASEFYLAITTDRANGTNALIASSEGGVEIETVAHENPDAIQTVHIDPLIGLVAEQATDMATNLGFTGSQVEQARDIMLNLSKLVQDTDASLAEINPLIVTPKSEKSPDGEVIAIDAKFNFDDNALFRHPELREMFDPTEENASELRASEFGLNFIALDGNIGCLVNGAGLAMATMDIIKLHGGSPANFLDVGGAATLEAVKEAFNIILSDDKVEGVLVNIFGGIMKCDVIAEAIVLAAKEVGFKVPLVVRLEGTNVDAAREILKDAQQELPTMQTATDLEDAAVKVASAVATACA
jgi:succinyl-CoA synthetase beta subunit|tara:strand:+ start:304 stop:1512 length:1209 start_codon:yes stop_codon:yes gene_type:complete